MEKASVVIKNNCMVIKNPFLYTKIVQPDRISMDVFAPFKKRYILLHIFINKTEGIYSNIVFSKNNAFTETEDYDEISKDFKKK